MGPVALDRALNDLHTSYTKHVNALRHRSGTLFDARLRQRAMVEIYQGGYEPKEIGDFFGRNKGTVVHAVKKSQQKIERLYLRGEMEK